MSPGWRSCHEQRPPNFAGPQQACHPEELEISWVRLGNEGVRLGSRALVMSAGEYLLIGPGVIHSSHTLDGPVEESNLHLGSELLRDAACELGLGRTGDWPLGPFCADRELASLLLRLPLDPGAAQEVCGRLLDRHLGARIDRLTAPDRSAAHRLGRAVELMHARLGEPISLAELAAVAQMSRFRFVHAFKARYQLPPYAYLMRLRVRGAADRIASSETSLTEIAFEVGFGSSGRLSEAFKRAYGITPSTWRRRFASDQGRHDAGPR